MKSTVQERFWSKVDTSSGPDGCWLWMAARDNGGYGNFWNGNAVVKAHRHSFAIAHGLAPTMVDHKCRNRSCVNPSHLRPATPLQNSENTGMRRDNTSGYKGVSRHRDGRWQASVSHRGKIHYLGLHDTPEQAATVARNARNNMHTHNEGDRA